MLDWFSDVSLWMLTGLFLAGILAFLMSTLAGGGGALVLVPVLNAVVGANQTAVVLNLGTFIGRPARLILFWHDVDWRIVRYYAPAAIIGSWLGAYLFATLNLSWLQILIGLFLVSTVFQFRWGKQQRSFIMPVFAFIPLGLVVSLLGTLVGALGPVLNPFYLNAGLMKESMVATKTANSFLMGLAQLSGYAYFGALNATTLVLGLALGIGAVGGNILGKYVLQKISTTAFLRWIIAFMVISGAVLIYQGIQSLL